MTPSSRIAILLVLCASASLGAEEPAKNSEWLITVSKETTHLTTPLTDDGLVDYFEALDQHLCEDVTVDNNAGVLIAQAFGPKIIDEPAREDFYRRLGIEPLEEHESNFVSLEDYLADIGFRADAEQMQDRQYEFYRRPWKRSDEATLHQWIVRNEAALNQLVAASRREKLYLPQITPGAQNASFAKTFFTVPVVEFEIRKAALVLCARAMLHVGEGRAQAAHEDIVAVHRLAALLSQAPNLTTKVMSYSVESRACMCDHLIACHGELSADDALQMRRAVEELPPLEGIVESIDIGERYRALDLAQSLAHVGLERLIQLLGDGGPLTALFRNLPTGSVINLDIALKMLNDFHDRMVAALEEKDPTKSKEMLASIDADLRRIMQKPGDVKRITGAIIRGESQDELGRVTGEVLLVILLPPLQTVHEFETCVFNLRDMARLSFSLAAHHADEDQYPAQLGDLMPKYLGELPVDRCSGDSFRYQVTGDRFRLYSVGPNGMDDQGRIQDSIPAGDDVSIDLGIQ